jgi:hypothetical protein
MRRATFGPTREEIGMKVQVHGFLAGILLTTAAAFVAAQPPAPSPGRAGAATPGPGGVPVPVIPTAAATDPTDELEARQADLAKLRAQQAALKPADDDQKKQIELLQKQVETLEKMIKLLAEQLKKAPPDAEKVATLEARSVQAARRDQELAAAVDDLREHADAEERYGPWLPAPLKELFLPSQTNESPISIYGQFLENYSQFNAQAGRFSTPDFAPYFLLQLNEKFLLEANLDFTNASTVSIGTAQMDWFLSDHLTFIVGRFLTPIGFFNERLNHEWINKLPDPALMYQQVSPLSSTDGVQLRGSTYLCCTPLKVEYSAYAGNGFQLATSAVGAGLNTVADLGALAATDVVGAKAIGGRIGLWAPEQGINVGVSTYLQGGYSPGDIGHLELWGFDLNYHKGNWDARFEYAEVFQQATAFIGNDIRRMGLYAQLAYRPYDAPWHLLRNTEVVGRYSLTRFGGIDPTQLNVAAFADPRAVPVNGDQWTFGVNFYLSPGMNFKFAYEVNNLHGPTASNPNVFLAQFVWAF